jgi:high-affinity Fe2+/Pb2+ permease
MVWKDFTAGKALFYSFFAVWRNRWAFLRYGLAWTILIVFISLIIALFGEILGAEPRMVFTAVLPISMVLIAVAQGSFYASTRDVFEVRDPPERIDTLA